MSSGSPVTILTSGIGLGVYMPALLIRRRMRAMGVKVDVETLEAYYTPDGQRGHLSHKQAYHDNFDLALVGHRMARGVDGSLDRPRLDELLRRWAAEGRRDFIVWSGFWLPILEGYRKLTGVPARVDCCRIDAVVSASFRPYDGLAPDSTEIWLWNWEDKKTVFEILVDDRAALPFSARDHRLVVHGGGWGIGTYRRARAELSDAPGGEGAWACDIVVHDRAEAAHAGTADRFFMVDPSWRTWNRGDDGHTFPPFAEVCVGTEPPEASTPAVFEHALFELIRRAKAIVSKPGGGTLIDSLASATPVILLPPLGYAEERNGALWEQLGFGIPFQQWRETGCRESTLSRLHHNLLRRPKGPDYSRAYVERLGERPRG